MVQIGSKYLITGCSVGMTSVSISLVDSFVGVLVCMILIIGFLVPRDNTNGGHLQLPVVKI